MTPRRRRLLNVASLLLFATTVPLYARSFLDAEGVALTWAQTHNGTVHPHGRYLISDTVGIIFRSTTSQTNDPGVMVRLVPNAAARGRPPASAASA